MKRFFALYAMLAGATAGSTYFAWHKLDVAEARNAEIHRVGMLRRDRLDAEIVDRLERLDRAVRELGDRPCP